MGWSWLSAFQEVPVKCQLGSQYRGAGLTLGDWPARRPPSMVGELTLGGGPRPRSLAVDRSVGLLECSRGMASNLATWEPPQREPVVQEKARRTPQCRLRHFHSVSLVTQVTPLLRVWEWPHKATNTLGSGQNVLEAGHHSW